MNYLLHGSCLLVYVLRHYHLQRAGADAVVQRRREYRDLAIGGDGEALGASRLDPDFACAERVEVVCLAQATEECAQGQPQKPQTPRAVCDVEAQVACVQTRARAQL